MSTQQHGGNQDEKEQSDEFSAECNSVVSRWVSQRAREDLMLNKSRMSVIILLNAYNKLKKNLTQLRLWSTYTNDSLKTEKKFLINHFEAFKCRYLNANILLQLACPIL